MAHNILYSVCYYIFSVILILIIIRYHKKYKLPSLWKYIKGMFIYYDKHLLNYSSNTWNIFGFTAKTIKELFWLIISLLFSVFILLYILSNNFHKQHLVFIENFITNFSGMYHLLTSIIGAFIALVLNYFFIRPKIYVSPHIIYEKRSRKKKFFTFTVKNESLMACTDIKIEAYKAKRVNGALDLSKPLKFRDPYAMALSSRIERGDFNCMSFTLKRHELNNKDFISPNFDFILVQIKFTHALSNVTNVITTQYQIEDIYFGQIQEPREYVNTKKGDKVLLKTIKSIAHTRFIKARKYVTLSAMLLFITYIISRTMLFANEYINIIINTWSVSIAIAVIYFAFLRFLYHFPTYTEREDENASYRVVNILNSSSQKKMNI